MGGHFTRMLPQTSFSFSMFQVAHTLVTSEQLLSSSTLKVCISTVKIYHLICGLLYGTMSVFLMSQCVCCIGQAMMWPYVLSEISLPKAEITQVFTWIYFIAEWDHIMCMKLLDKVWCTLAGSSKMEYETRGVSSKLLFLVFLKS